MTFASSARGASSAGSGVCARPPAERGVHGRRRGRPAQQLERASRELGARHARRRRDLGARARERAEPRLERLRAVVVVAVAAAVVVVAVAAAAAGGAGGGLDFTLRDVVEQQRDAAPRVAQLALERRAVAAERAVSAAAAAAVCGPQPRAVESGAPRQSSKSAQPTLHTSARSSSAVAPRACVTRSSTRVVPSAASRHAQSSGA